MPLYDSIGQGYALNRRADSRWAAIILDALPPAGCLVNVGAGAGSYEPDNRPVVALEPSRTMIAQRAASSAAVVQGVAAALPFTDDSFAGALAILTVHHWPDAALGLAELQRVARRQVVLTWDPAIFAERFWFVREYLPVVAVQERRLAAAPLIAATLPNNSVIPLPVPHDCSDGVFGAYWRRPHAYLEASVRASISAFSRVDPARLRAALARLQVDLATGEWHRRHEALLTLDELDLGYCLVVGDRSPATAPDGHPPPPAPASAARA